MTARAFQIRFAAALVAAAAGLGAGRRAVPGAGGEPPAAPGGAGTPYSTQEIDLGRGAEHVHWGPRRPGRRLDLFVLAGREVRIWLQAEAGFPGAPSLAVEIPEEAGLVDIGDLAGDGGEEIAVITRRGVLVEGAGGGAGAAGAADESRPRPAGKAASSFTRLLPPPAAGRGGAAGAVMPLELVHASFLRDLDGDGLAELLVPVRGGYALHARRPAEGGGERAFREAAFLEAPARVSIDSSGPGILDPLRLELSIPSLRFKDLNGDGRLDIAARAGDATLVYLQGAAGFPAAPTYRFDLDRFRREEAEAGKRQPLEIARPGSGGVEAREEDIDGDGVQDYLITSGRVLRVFFGEKSGVDFSRPHTVLKFSEEVRGAGSFDIDGDGRRDLVALKFETPTLPRLIAAYFTSAALDFEVLGYRNQGGRSFSRRPDRRNTLTLVFPPLRRVVENFDAFAARFLEQAEKRRRFAGGDVDGDGVEDAVFLDDDGRLRVFLARGRGPLPQPELGDILFDAEKREWQLEELLDFIANAAFAAQRRAVAGRTPDLEVEVGRDYDRDLLNLGILDLNGDGAGDFALRWRPERIKLLLSAGKPARPAPK